MFLGELERQKKSKLEEVSDPNSLVSFFNAHPTVFSHLVTCYSELAT